MQIVTLTPDAPAIYDDVIAALMAATKDNRAAAADFIDEMGNLGFTFVGPSNFDFRSGSLFWQAHTLLRLAHAAEQRRQAILTRRGGKEPVDGDPDWPEWCTSSLEAGASAAGARLLGYASLEAFVNEVLYVNFPAMYEEYEDRSGAKREVPWSSVSDKLARLLKELGLPGGSGWLRKIREEAPIRRGIEHHKLKPDFTEPSGGLDSVGYDDGASPGEVAEFLKAVQDAFRVLCDAYGVELPPTHRPPLAF